MHSDVVDAVVGYGGNSLRRLHVLHSTRSRFGRRMEKRDRKEIQNLYGASSSRWARLSRRPLGLSIDEANDTVDATKQVQDRNQLPFIPRYVHSIRSPRSLTNSKGLHPSRTTQHLRNPN